MGLFSSVKKITSSIGDVINPVSDLIGGAASAYGAYQQQASSEKMAKDQMKFQKEMSSTAHQRQVEDLKKAGLNPILSANSGASSPGGAMGQAQNVAGSGVQQYMQLRQANSAIKLQDAQADKIRADINPVEYVGQLLDSLGTAYKNAPPWLKQVAESLGLTAKDFASRQITNQPGGTVPPGYFRDKDGTIRSKKTGAIYIPAGFTHPDRPEPPFKFKRN